VCHDDGLERDDFDNIVRDTKTPIYAGGDAITVLIFGCMRAW